MHVDDIFGSSPEQQVAQAVQRANRAIYQELSEQRPASDNNEPFGVDHAGSYSNMAEAYSVGSQMQALGILPRR